ncbi:MAG: hypothetical protein ABSG83_07260 [Roseiarcus sp.]|jgi:hypothetical protein
MADRFHFASRFVALSVLAASALALDAPQASPAHVEGLYCASVAGPHDRIVGAGGSWTALTADQLEFARGLWASMQASHGRLPLGHAAFLSRGGNEPADSVYFIDDGMICARMFVSRGLAERIVDVGAGLITHSGDAS